MSQLVNKVRQLIRQNQIKDSFEIIFNWYDSNSELTKSNSRFSIIRSELLLISNKFRSIIDDQRLGIVEHQTTSIDKSRVIKQYIELLDSFEEIIEDELNKLPGYKKSIELELLFRKDLAIIHKDLLSEIFEWISRLLTISEDNLQVGLIEPESSKVKFRIPTDSVGKLFQLYKVEALDFLNIKELKVVEELPKGIQVQHDISEPRETEEIGKGKYSMLILQPTITF